MRLWRSATMGCVLPPVRSVRRSCGTSPRARSLNRVSLPPGLINRIAFRSPGQLLVFRCETSDGRQLPLYDNNFQDHPRVCRVRDLLSPNPLTPLVELREFNRRVNNLEVVPGGQGFIVEGSRRGRPRSVQCPHGRG